MASQADLFTLHRYFIWADRMRYHFDGLLHTKGEAIAAGKEPIEPFLYMSYWYGGMYVVIEGWKKLGLSDPRIDELLESPNVRLLKRYRNGVFHFQKRYFDNRFMELWRDGHDAVAWVRGLSQALGEFLLAHLERPATGCSRE